MVITQKFDHRKRSERRIFFSLKLIPFFVLFMLVLLLVFNSTSLKKEKLSGGISGEISRGGPWGISGEVVQATSLDKGVYHSGEDVSGRVKVNLDPSDYLSLNTSFIVTFIGQCPRYYVCGDGSEVLWKYANCSSADDEPWATCGDGVQTNQKRSD